MMRRRTAISALMTGLLASCAKKKAPILGLQIPLIQQNSGMDVAVDAPKVVLPPAQSLASWPQSWANAAHAPGNVAGPTGFKPLWHANVGAPGGYRQTLLASPLLANGQVFTLDADAVVRAFSAQDGKAAWHTVTRPKHASEQNIGGGIAYDSGRVYASTGYSELLALDAGSGKILWRQKLDFPARSAPTVADGLVTVLTLNDLLLSFDAVSGTPGWRFVGNAAGQENTAAVGITGGPAYADGIIVAGFSTGTLAGIDANSGTPVWEQSLAAGFGQASSADFSDIVAAPVIAGGVVYAVNLGGTLLAVDLHSGVKVWGHAAFATQTPCLAGAFLFLLDKTQKLYAVHTDDGLVSWSVQMPLFLKPKEKKKPLLWTAPMLLNGQLVLLNDHGQMVQVDPGTGTLGPSSKPGAAVDMPPIAANGLVLQLTRDAKLTAYG